MTNAQELKTLLEEQLIPELEIFMDNIFEEVAAKRGTDEDKEALEEARELRKEFQEILDELERDELDEEECAGLLEELAEMRDDEYEENEDEDRDEEE